jgi:acetyltransferase-like isoleucine patch superfamily enzyme
MILRKKFKKTFNINLNIYNSHYALMIKRLFINKLFSAWDLLFIKLDFAVSTHRSLCSLNFQGCSVGKGFRTSGKCYFKARRSRSIRIGKGVILLAGHRSNRVGLMNPVLLETLGEGEIEIGDATGASALVISARSSVRIGCNVKIGGNVRIYDHDFHSLCAETRRLPEDIMHVKSRPVEISDDVFIGTNAIILKGVSIGSKSIIAAGSVVTKSVPPNQIWGGNPAKFISNI